MQTMTAQDMTVARRVRQLREDLGLEIQEAAEKAGVSKQTWSRIENGHYLPRGRTAQMMADALGVTVAALFSDGDALRMAPRDQFEMLLLTTTRGLSRDARERVAQFVATLTVQ